MLSSPCAEQYCFGKEEQASFEDEKGWLLTQLFIGEAATVLNIQFPNVIPPHELIPPLALLE